MEETTSKLDPNHKRKETDKKFKFMDLKEPGVDKYLKQDKYCRDYWDYIHSSSIGEIVIDGEEEKIAGYIFVDNKKYPGFITPLMVIKKYRGYGLGAKLLEDAIHKYNAIDLCVDKTNEIAIKLYKDHGFEIIGDGNSKKQHWMKLKSATIVTESYMKSKIIDDFKPKGNKRLSEFKRVKVSDATKIDPKYKKQIKIRDFDKYDYGYIWVDDEDDFVALCTVSALENTEEYAWMKYISGIEVSKKYQGYGLSYQLLDVAVKELGGNVLNVATDNVVAQKVYEKYGFKVISSHCRSSKFRLMALKSEIPYNESAVNHLYFYHMVDRDSDMTNGLISPEYMYRHGMTDLFLKNTDKDLGLIKHESTILTDRGYYKLVDTYKDPKYCSWDEEQTYPTINLNIRAEKCYDKDMYCYSLDQNTYEITYIGKLHVSELIDDEYSIKWLDKSNEPYLLESTDYILNKVIEFNDEMNQFEYILVDPNTKRAITQITDELFTRYYRHMNTQEFLRYNGGVCWDYVMYEANWFKSHIPGLKFKSFFVSFGKEYSSPTHTFILFQLDHKYYWFESSWKTHTGIYEFNSWFGALTYIISELRKPVGAIEREFVTTYNPTNPSLYGMNESEYMDYMFEQPEILYRKVREIPRVIYKGTVPGHQSY